MKHSRLIILFVIALAVIAAGLLFDSIGNAHKLAAQDADKSLDIERYPNEPLELVDLRIGQNSVKNGIRFKFKENISKWGLDNVKFKDKDDWFKNVQVRLRNVSGRPIYGLSTSLYFKDSRLRTIFGVDLKQTKTRSLKEQPLQPGDEIDLQVSDKSFDEAMTTMRQFGVDPNGLPVSISVNNALFSDDFQWSRGSFLRRDPYSPNKWDAVDKPLPPGASRLKQPAGFTLISFKSGSSPVPDLTRCQAVKAGFIGYPCSGDYDFCWRIEEQGTGQAGSMSNFNFPGKCRDHNDASAMHQ